MRNDKAKDQPKCTFIHPKKGIHCTMHALPGSRYCTRHKWIEDLALEDTTLIRRVDFSEAVMTISLDSPK